MNRRLHHSAGLRALLGALAGLLASMQGWAQPAGEWQVELVVVGYRTPPPTSEQVLEPAVPARPLPLVPMPSLAGDADAATESSPTRYPLLETEALQLGLVAQRLARSADFTPLLHVAWQQDAPARRAAAEPQDLSLLASGEGLHGTVRLYRRQSLHVELDLWLPADDVDGSAGRYRLRETRIVRSGELSYFDHPRLGAIIKVSPAAAGDTGS